MTATIKTAKVANYSDEQTAKMLAEYVGEFRTKATVEKLALEMGKSVRSIVAKLSREKVYLAQEYKTKTGEKVEKKDETADAIGAVLKMTEPEIESLTKANKTALKKIWVALANSVPMTPENETQAVAGENATKAMDEIEGDAIADNSAFDTE